MKPIRQIANLRQGQIAVVFGDSDQEGEYMLELERARARGARAGHRFVVAPKCRVELPDGRFVEAEMPVTRAELETRDERGWSILQRLVNRGLVLECHAVRNLPDDEGPAAA